MSHNESVIYPLFFGGILDLKVQPFILNAAALFRVRVDLNMNKHLAKRHTSLKVPFFTLMLGIMTHRCLLLANTHDTDR